MQIGHGESSKSEPGKSQETEVATASAMKIPVEQQPENGAHPQDQPERRPEETSEETAKARQIPTLTPAPRLSRRRVTWMAAGAAVLLLAILVGLLADAAHSANSGAVPPSRPRAQATATPTSTVTPSPTPMLGFRYFTDTADGLQIQYPLNWASKPLNPGAAFYDDQINPSYEIQILIPSDATSAGPTTQPNDASVWVNYELSHLENLLQGQLNVQQVPGPTPPQTIGGVAWQSGVALITQGSGANQVRFRVKIYATVHNSVPYIITLLASDDRFPAGTIEFFTPMLQSFQFLPTSA